MKSVAFVTTCKSRLHHIKQTLPPIVAQAPDEIVVVDYGCPDKSGDWIEDHYPTVKVVRVNDDEDFCVARARNIGVAATSSEWICFIDADILITPGWLDWLRQNLHPSFHFRSIQSDRIKGSDTWGTVLCTRQAFARSGGYDEVFRGWGGEDNDFHSRLQLAGYSEAQFPAEYLQAIEHDDKERYAHYSIKSKLHSRIINKFYRVAKLQIMALNNLNPDIPLDIRKQIRNEITSALRDWNPDDTREYPDVSLTFNSTGWLPPPYRMKNQVTLTLSIEKQDESSF
ncbi:glycosyltransferase family 2 protein [Solemya velum gill symbiont]|uniref:glycosyltransferase family 2 protein n=1 Tax=Solemya velum gill symbiont TaxID=2340 RepID=UPI0009971256|nr:glycosyltransferase family A protein [Solemya velum gill symbiont]OOY49704.1 hypothetical protein BOV97_12500 [Solemya velum gill symbiont]OOY54178.1 hypothetical protein BOV99_11905 [Solemya velum gill symbiont]OOY54264.1 hypothetical protein BOW00_11910 [Solemya velum gill symbiont]OOY58959.1 hypothetical protein BOW02_11810 [Solemya velum gill symbiont]OOY59840.1 hypothetical protein BOW04_11885 [Solemya velum gill symbiont]